MTFTGIPAGLVASGYAVILYFDGDNQTFDRLSQFTLSAAGLGTKTLYGLDPANVGFAGTFKVVPGYSTADLGSATPAGNVLVFSGLKADSFTLTVSGARASDGNSRGALNAIQLVNLGTLPAMPAVAITGPTNGSIVTTCRPVTFTFATSDTSAAISKGKLFSGATQLGESSTSPFRIDWEPKAVGTFSLTARVTDSQGVTAASDPTGCGRSAAEPAHRGRF